MNFDQIIHWLKTRGLTKDSESMLRDYLKDQKILHNFNLMVEASKANQHVVYLECFPSYFVSISIDSQKLHAYLSLIGFQSDIHRIRTLIEGAASSQELILEYAVPEVMDGLEGRDFLSAPLLQTTFMKGVSSSPAKPADAELLVKPISDSPEYEENDDGSLDYTDLHLFENVMAEQHIADHMPAIAGVNGRDIYGALIASQQVTKDVVQLGSGVMFDEMQQKYFAVKAGYVTYEDGKLNVEDTYVVERNIDFRVGNINFVSHVKVRGDVLSDFSIRAGGDLEIHGTVTGAALQVEKDLRMSFGILGQGKSHIQVNGNASVKFLNEAHAEVLGSLEVLREVLNSNIACFGEIHAKDAVVIGGRIVGLKAMHIGTLGSELGLKTQVFLGEDFNTLSRAEQLRENVMDIKERVELLLDQHQSSISKWQFDRIKEKLEIKKVDEEMVKMKEFGSVMDELVQLSQELDELSHEPPEGREPICHIYNNLYPGTSFFCSGGVLDIKEMHKGPVTIMAEKEKNRKKYKVFIKEGS